MNRIQRLTEEYGLETDDEHIIIPYVSSSGEKRKVYLLKREHMVLEHGKDMRITVPIEEVVAAIVGNPGGSIWETLGLSERLRHHSHGDPAHGDPAHDEPSKEGGD
ncbi:MAG: hypothetical protein HZA20_13080 [Nitrospirae bacterium]|nr:hypothetical protein [Nitrospirota bacterium]